MFTKRSKKTGLLLVVGIVVTLGSVLAVARVGSSAYAQTANLGARDKKASDFDEASNYSKLRTAGLKIGEKLCKGKQDRSECINGHEEEYKYLGWKVCESKDSKSKRKSCYTDFVKKNTSMGKARKAAGFNPDDIQDATTAKTKDFDAPADPTAKTKNLTGFDDVCGNSKDNDENVRIHFNFGCLGPGYDIKVYGALNPIEDIIYAIIRFMALGVGIIVVISIIIAGIQYTSSEGNPEVTQQAKDRIRFTMFGLFLYIFAYTIMQYLVPGGLFK